MMTNEAGVDLLEALSTLRVAERELSRDVEQPLTVRDAPLRHLEEVIHVLGQAKTEKAPSQSEEYVRQWQEFLLGSRPQLERRAVRYLCWEPDVATDMRFQNYLDGEHVDISPRWLQGLVRSCHVRWSPEFVTGPVVKRVRRRLESYQGPNRLLLGWKNALAMILGARGPAAFADYIIESRQAIKVCCDEWGLDEQSQYALEAVRQAVRQCHERMGQIRRVGQYLLDHLLPWSNWPLQDFKDAVAATILHPKVSEIHEPLTNFVLRDTRLGDPRLPRNARKWIGVQEGARLRLIQWLSRADIVFFFEYVLPSGQDTHGRKAFWLRYVPSLRMSRPLLSENDATHLRTTMRQMGEQIGHFGRMLGSTSAFLLDFGPILVVEFSQRGNACYLYERKVVDEVVPDFWMEHPFSQGHLKRRNVDHTRIPHQQKWQYEMEKILAQHGIRRS